MGSVSGAAHNTAIGTYALFNNVNGAGNTAIGTGTLSSSTGNDNVAIGSDAGQQLESGNKNIFIGNNANPVTTTASNTLNIGNGIFGVNFNSVDVSAPAGLVGIGENTPQELLDLKGTATAGQGGIRIQKINSPAYTSATSTDKIVVADANDVLKTMPAANTVKAASSLSGAGNAYACINAAGELFRSAAPCAP